MKMGNISLRVKFGGGIGTLVVATTVSTFQEARNKVAEETERGKNGYEEKS